MIWKEGPWPEDLKYEGGVRRRFGQMTLQLVTGHHEDKAVMITVTHLLSSAAWLFHLSPGLGDSFLTKGNHVTVRRSWVGGKEVEGKWVEEREKFSLRIESPREEEEFEMLLARYSHSLLGMKTLVR